MLRLFDLNAGVNHQMIMFTIDVRFTRYDIQKTPLINKKSFSVKTLLVGTCTSLIFMQIAPSYLKISQNGVRKIKH